VAENSIADQRGDGPRHRYQDVGLIIGPMLAIALWLLPGPVGLSEEGWIVVGLAAWMAAWWSTEAIPVPATSLLPLIVLPLSGVASPADASRPFTEPVIFLLLGGFIMAMAMQRWGLHKRIALNIVARSGERPASLVLGFMAAAALLSMWISNTATTLMMVPIALTTATTLLGSADSEHPFMKALLLGVAWSASIGGLGTIIGTPPNAFVVGFVRETQGLDIAFIEWMAFGIPVVALMVPAAWLVVTRLSFRFDTAELRGGHQVVAEQLAALGPMSPAEARTALVFGLVGLAWAGRLLLNDLPGLGGLTDMGIAVIGAVAMFLIPAGRATEKGTTLLNWSWAVRLPWGVILLFGGGLSLANAIQATGLAQWLGNAFSPFTAMPLIVIMLALVLLIIFLTELTSNTATVAALVPVLASVAMAGDFPAIYLAAPAAMAGSSAFMLPVATAPNAIVFASGHVHIPDMVKAGLKLNLLGTLLISVACWAIVPAVF